MQHYLVTVRDHDAGWIDAKMATGHRLFISSCVPKMHISGPLAITKIDDLANDTGPEVTDYLSDILSILENVNSLLTEMCDKEG